MQQIRLGIRQARSRLSKEIAAAEEEGQGDNCQRRNKLKPKLKRWAGCKKA